MTASRWMPLAELRDRSDEWRSLLGDSEFPNAFADPGWLLAWWDSFGEHHEPWTFVLEDGDGSMRALALLALDASGPARTLSFAGGSWNGLETLVCASESEAAFAQALLGALHERRGEWETWRIQRLPAESALAATLTGAGAELRAAAHGVRLQPYLELPASFEEYEAQFGSKQRSTQRRKWRKLTALGASPRLVDDPTEAQSTLRELLDLRRRRAAEMGQRHKHMEARYERFLQSAVAGLLPSGARLWTLELEGVTLASRLNLIAGCREHSYLLGLSEEHANLSPGNSLELHAIRSAIEQGRSEFELGPGRDTYKYRLGGRDRELMRLVASSGSARGRAVTAFAAADLRLRDTRAADMLRRRLGMTPLRETHESRTHDGAASEQKIASATRE
jgi:CelD/BcsL family acetyltransferase involved in cellulose biosynthesis